MRVSYNKITHRWAITCNPGKAFACRTKAPNIEPSLTGARKSPYSFHFDSFNPGAGIGFSDAPSSALIDLIRSRHHTLPTITDDRTLRLANRCQRIFITGSVKRKAQSPRVVWVRVSPPWVRPLSPAEPKTEPSPDSPSIREAREFMDLAELFVRARRPWLAAPDQPARSIASPSTAKPLDQFVDCGWIAERTGLNVRTIRRMARTKQIPGASHSGRGGHWRFKKSVVLAWLANIT